MEELAAALATAAAQWDGPEEELEGFIPEWQMGELLADAVRQIRRHGGEAGPPEWAMAEDELEPPDVDWRALMRRSMGPIPHEPGAGRGGPGGGIGPGWGPGAPGRGQGRGAGEAGLGPGREPSLLQRRAGDAHEQQRQQGEQPGAAPGAASGSGAAGAAAAKAAAGAAAAGGRTAAGSAAGPAWPSSNGARGGDGRRGGGMWRRVLDLFGGSDNDEDVGDEDSEEGLGAGPGAGRAGSGSGGDSMDVDERPPEGRRLGQLAEASAAAAAAAASTAAPAAAASAHGLAAGPSAAAAARPAPGLPVPPPPGLLAPPPPQPFLAPAGLPPLPPPPHGVDALYGRHPPPLGNAAEALEHLTRDRLRLRRAVLSLSRSDLGALQTHGSHLEALSLHYVRTPPDVIALLTEALPRLRRLSLRWANDTEAVGGAGALRAPPCKCCAPEAARKAGAESAAAAGACEAASQRIAGGGSGVAAAGARAAAVAGMSSFGTSASADARGTSSEAAGAEGGCGGGGAGGGVVTLSTLPPLLESLELGGAVSLQVTAADPSGPGGSGASAGPMWLELRRLALTDGLALPDGALPALLAHTPFLTELQLQRPRRVAPADLAALEQLDRLRTLVLDLDSADLECRNVRAGFAEGITRVAALTALQELRWNVPEPHSARRRSSGPTAEAQLDTGLLLCQQLPALTSLQRLSLLSLPSCRTLLPRLDSLQALRHLPFLEISTA